MDTGTVGAISTVLVTIAFFGVCLWAFSPKLKKRFDEDAKLPFADEPSAEKPKDQQPGDQKTDDQQPDNK